MKNGHLSDTEHRARWRVVGLTVAAALALPQRGASAAPADEQPVLVSSERFAEAQRRLDDGQPDAAIELLESALEEFPDEPGYRPMRARILLLIVQAQQAGFALDGQLDRLRTAKRLLDRFLGPLELLDEQGRADAEERRSRLIGEIAAIEAARGRDDAERARAARRERAARVRSQARSLTVAGAVTTSFGLAGLVMMATGLGVGRSSENRIQTLGAICPDAMQNCAEPHGEIQEIRLRGNRGNVMALTGAIVGGVLLLGGIGLLAVARDRRSDARVLEVAPAPVVGRGSLGLGLVARF